MKTNKRIILAILSAVVVTVLFVLLFIFKADKLAPYMAKIGHHVIVTDNDVQLYDISITDIKNLDSSYFENVNSNRVENVYPHINSDLTISGYTNGNMVDIDKLYSRVSTASSGDIIDVNDYIISEDNLSPSEAYQKLSEVCQKYTDFNITYTNGMVIDVNDLLKFITIDNDQISVNFDSDDFTVYVDELVREKTDSYNTYYNTWTVNSPVNGSIQVTTDPKFYGKAVYGSKVDFDSEIEYITEAIKNLESENDRTPVLSVDNGFEIPSTFIEVSIEDQHLWYYIDGELKLESNVVTGRKNRMDTPTGVYQVFQKCHGIAFDGGARGQNWMRFSNYGHGLHDATWRPARDFESNQTYINNGSHGCINLPLDFSSELYDAVDEGTVVVVY